MWHFVEFVLSFKLGIYHSNVSVNFESDQRPNKEATLPTQIAD
jgi:hypothetical protein